MSEQKNLADYRRDYESQGIRKIDLNPDPIRQFENWLNQALELNLIDATAMTLATASSDAIPSARIVLLKSYDDQGFCWYTDSQSQKGREIAANPQASLLFHWRDLSRQVRVQGRVEALTPELAESYFHSRPEGSRFSAAASRQSSVVADRGVLENEVQRLRELYPDGQVPRPERWTGYRLRPLYFEFWQGLVNRMHDRIVYCQSGDGWSTKRISP